MATQTYITTPPLILNPAVAAEAALFTDGQVTDAILRGVASMRGLPLMVESAPWAAPDALTLAERELAAATHAQRAAAECFAGACRRLGQANRRTHPPLRAGGPCCGRPTAALSRRVLRWPPSRPDQIPRLAGDPGKAAEWRVSIPHHPA